MNNNNTYVPSPGDDLSVAGGCARLPARTRLVRLGT